MLSLKDIRAYARNIIIVWPIQCGLVVALIIFVTIFGWHQHSKRIEQAKKTELDTVQEVEQKKQDAINQLKDFHVRYLGNQSERYSIAVMVANEQQKPNQSLGQALCDILNTNGLTSTASLFTPDFISDGLLDRMLAGSKFDKLELTNSVQNIMLAHQSVTYSTNSALNFITATMTCNVSAYSTSAFQMLFADTIKVAGAGLTSLEARTMAEDKVLKQLADGRLNKVQTAILAETK